MIFDFEVNDIDDNTEYDLCIVGAGAAGITLAHTLKDTGLKICMLEAGGDVFSEESQAVYHGVNIGRPYYELNETRLRFLGGTTNHWEGLCVPLQEHDFNARYELNDYEGIHHTGWPIQFEEIAPYFDNAATFLGLQDNTFDNTLLPAITDGQPVFEENRFQHRFWRQSPTSHRFFRLTHKQWLEESGNIDLFLNAAVTTLEHHENVPDINSLSIENFSGKKAKVQARHYVLACGGLEIPRLLLANNQQISGGIGNSSGLIGRYFTEHVEVYVGSIHSQENPMEVYTTFDHKVRETPSGVRIFPGFTMTADEQERLGVLNCNLAIQTMRNPDSPINSIKSLTADIQNKEWPDKTLSNLWNVVSGLDTLYNEWQLKKGEGDPMEDMVTGIFARSEQAPNYNSYLKLDPANKDQFGTPRLQVNWKLSDLDMKTIKVTTQAFGAELARQKLGRVKLLDWVENEQWGLDTQGGHHHLGTTRMGPSSNEGVVNTHLRLFDIENMSILSSAVFPTGGYANPTMSIVAFAFRLGDHFKRVFKV